MLAGQHGDGLLHRVGCRRLRVVGSQAEKDRCRADRVSSLDVILEGLEDLVNSRADVVRKLSYVRTTLGGSKDLSEEILLWLKWVFELKDVVQDTSGCNDRSKFSEVFRGSKGTGTEGGDLQ